MARAKAGVAVRTAAMAPRICRTQVMSMPSVPGSCWSTCCFFERVGLTDGLRLVVGGVVVFVCFLNVWDGRDKLSQPALALHT